MRALFVEMPAFARYRADYLDDLTAKERAVLKDMLKREITARRKA